MTELTHARLRELLNYDPVTGTFTWLVDRNRGRYKAGQTAGANLKRYRQLWIDGEKYLAHRVAWFWMTGQWPADQIDHRDTDGFNNRWLNLREATVSQNAMNHSGKSRISRSGIKGVSFVKDNKWRGRPWKATIQKDGRRRFLGQFSSAEEAGEAYRRAASEFHGEFARAA